MLNHMVQYIAEGMSARKFDFPRRCSARPDPGNSATPISQFRHLTENLFSLSIAFVGGALFGAAADRRLWARVPAGARRLFDIVDHSGASLAGQALSPHLLRGELTDDARPFEGRRIIRTKALYPAWNKEILSAARRGQGGLCGQCGHGSMFSLIRVGNMLRSLGLSRILSENRFALFGMRSISRNRRAKRARPFEGRRIIRTKALYPAWNKEILGAARRGQGGECG